MANVTVTAGDVAIGDGAVQVDSGVLGETCTAGQYVYRSASDQKLYKADASDATKVRVIGQLLEGGAADATASYTRTGETVIDASVDRVTPYEVYYLSGTSAGSACDISELATDDTIVILGYASGARKIVNRIIYTGLVKA